MPGISDGNSTPATPVLNTKTSPPWCLFVFHDRTGSLAPSLPSPCSNFHSWGIPGQHPASPDHSWLWYFLLCGQRCLAVSSRLDMTIIILKSWPVDSPWWRWDS